MTLRPVALITGSSAGIGMSFAQQLAEQGFDLVLVARDLPRLTALADQLSATTGAAVEILVADLSQRDQLGLVETRLREGVDLLVNNAGFGLNKAFDEANVEEHQAMLDVLVTAVMRLTHAAIGPMLLAGSGGVINLSSVAGSLPGGSYHAAKAWLNTLSADLHHSYGPRGVNVMALCPGLTATEFHQRMGMSTRPGPGFLWQSPDEVVRVALSDFARGRAVSIPGAINKAVVAGSRFIPVTLARRITSRR